MKKNLDPELLDRFDIKEKDKVPKPEVWYYYNNNKKQWNILNSKNLMKSFKFNSIHFDFWEALYVGKDGEHTLHRAKDWETLKKIIKII